MENEQRRTCINGEEFHGVKISDLLPHLEWKRDPRGQHFHSQSQILFRPPSVSRAGDSLPDKGRGGLLPLLPDGIQRLAACQARQNHDLAATTPGSSSRGFRTEPTSDLAEITEAFSKAFTELFFLPYIAAGRPGVPRTETPAAIRDLFQQGVLSSQILGGLAHTRRRSSSMWLVLKEPYANSGTSEQYFEDLEDLQRKLFKGILQRSAGLMRPPQEPSSQRRALRNICLSNSSMCSSPPLVCRNQIYYTSFSK